MTMKLTSSPRPVVCRIPLDTCCAAELKGGSTKPCPRNFRRIVCIMFSCGLQRRAVHQGVSAGGNPGPGLLELRQPFSLRSGIQEACCGEGAK